jgi:hypothetical protein
MVRVKGRDDVCMSVKKKKRALEEKRRRLRSQGWDLDIIDKVRLQRLKEEEEKERETGDIYDDKQRGEMLEADEITAAENAFMQGREMTLEKRKRPTHKDTVSVELAEDEYKDD